MKKIISALLKWAAIVVAALFFCVFAVSQWDRSEQKKEIAYMEQQSFDYVPNQDDFGAIIARDGNYVVFDWFIGKSGKKHGLCVLTRAANVYDLESMEKLDSVVVAHGLDLPPIPDETEE